MMVADHQFSHQLGMTRAFSNRVTLRTKNGLLGLRLIQQT